MVCELQQMPLQPVPPYSWVLVDASTYIVQVGHVSGWEIATLLLLVCEAEIRNDVISGPVDAA